MHHQDDPGKALLCRQIWPAIWRAPSMSQRRARVSFRRKRVAADTQRVMVKQQKGSARDERLGVLRPGQPDKNGTKIVSHEPRKLTIFWRLKLASSATKRRVGIRPRLLSQDHGCAPLPLTRQMFHAISTPMRVAAGAAQRGGRRRAEKNLAHHRAAQEQRPPRTRNILDDASNRVATPAPNTC